VSGGVHIQFVLEFTAGGHVIGDCVFVALNFVSKEWYSVKSTRNSRVVHTQSTADIAPLFVYGSLYWYLESGSQ
jgi:hypothetical protein